MTGVDGGVVRGKWRQMYLNNKKVKKINIACIFEK